MGIDAARANLLPQREHMVSKLEAFSCKVVCVHARLFLVVFQKAQKEVRKQGSAAVVVNLRR
jgi:hypothetical protein